MMTEKKTDDRAMAAFRAKLDAMLAEKMANAVPFEQRPAEEKKSIEAAMDQALRAMDAHRASAGIDWEEAERIIAEEVAAVRKERTQRPQKPVKE